VYKETIKYYERERRKTLVTLCWSISQRHQPQCHQSVPLNCYDHLFFFNSTTLKSFFLKETFKINSNPYNVEIKHKLNCGDILKKKVYQ